MKDNSVSFSNLFWNKAALSTQGLVSLTQRRNHLTIFSYLISYFKLHHYYNIHQYCFICQVYPKICTLLMNNGFYTPLDVTPDWFLLITISAITPSWLGILVPMATWPRDMSISLAAQCSLTMTAYLAICDKSVL